VSDHEGGGHPGIDELFRSYARSRDRQTRNELVEQHIGLASHLARRYASRGVPLDDLRQIALLGLVKAVERFDPDRGVAFSTFAGRTIEGEIKRHFRDATWGMRVPRSTKELHLAVRRATDELGQQLGRSPTVRDVAEHLEISTDEVVEALAAGSAYTPASLYAPRPDEPEQNVDRNGAVGSVDPAFANSEHRVVIEDLIASLPDREQAIVRLRFYENLTQTEIAERVGISQMHVSRLLRKSLLVMRELHERE
jgi:RNA polymerase sigma-B factor